MGRRKARKRTEKKEHGNRSKKEKYSSEIRESRTR